jgi:hypothetical protein
MSAAAQRAASSMPQVRQPRYVLRPGEEDAVETVLRSTSPTDQATRSAMAILVRFDPESCFLEAGGWLLSAMIAYVALEAGYSRDRTLASVYRELSPRHESVYPLLERLRLSAAGDEYVTETVSLVLRKRPHEQAYIRMHVCEALEPYVQRVDEGEPCHSIAHIALTLPPEPYEALSAIAARQGCSLAMLGRTAIARMLHMRPHLALVPEERG